MKILVIEDEDNIRKLICYDLRHAGYEVDEASDGKIAKELGTKNQYDLMVIDWMLPFIDGISLVKTFREQQINSVLMMLTAKGEEEDILEAFEAGVDDYVAKPFSPRILLARIKAHLATRGSKPDKCSFNDLKIDEEQMKIYSGSKALDLTKTEYELLRYFIINGNVVLSRDQILNEIWGFDYDGDTRIVDVHTFKLRAKLKVDSQSVIASRRGVGYVLEKEHD